MKSTFATLILMSLTTAAFASPNCTKSEAIRKAAEKQARVVNSSHEASAGEISFTRTTRDGKKDMYTVQMTVNEECIAEVYVYTDANTCDVNGVAGGDLEEGACG